MQNVFITIVEDGYLSIKYKSNYDWLQNEMSHRKLHIEQQHSKVKELE